MVLKYGLHFTEEEVDLVCDLVFCPSKEKSWFHHIVNNKRFHLDTDKLDYLVRDGYHIGLKVPFDVGRILANIIVRNNNIYLHKSIENEINHLFDCREEMHKSVYRHKKTVEIQQFFLSRLLSSSIEMSSIDVFLSLTDEILLHRVFKTDDFYIFSSQELIGKALQEEIIQLPRNFESDRQREEALHNIKWISF